MNKETLRIMLDSAAQTALMNFNACGPDERDDKLRTLEVICKLRNEEIKASMEEAKVEIEKRKTVVEEQKLDFSRTECNARLHLDESKNAIESRKVDNEVERFTMDANAMEAQRIESLLRVAADVAGIVLPLLFYATWMKKGLKFEESGTFTSATFKGLIGKFKTTRK